MPAMIAETSGFVSTQGQETEEFFAPGNRVRLQLAVNTIAFAIDKDYFDSLGIEAGAEGWVRASGPLGLVLDENDGISFYPWTAIVRVKLLEVGE